MLSIDRQANSYVIDYKISAEVFSKLCIINFFQQADNFFWYRVIVLRDQILDKYNS